MAIEPPDMSDYDSPSSSFDEDEEMPACEATTSEVGERSVSGDRILGEHKAYNLAVALILLLVVGVPIASLVFALLPIREWFGCNGLREFITKWRVSWIVTLPIAAVLLALARCYTRYYVIVRPDGSGVLKAANYLAGILSSTRVIPLDSPYAVSSEYDEGYIVRCKSRSSGKHQDEAVISFGDDEETFKTFLGCLQQAAKGSARRG
jgi:hypothetical protein